MPLTIEIEDLWNGYDKTTNEKIESVDLIASELLRKERAARHFEGEEAQLEAVERIKENGFYGLFNVYAGGTSDKMIAARAAFIDLAR